MAKLVLSLNGTLLNQYFIDCDSLGIGREAGNEIVIDDPLLSRRHARILCVGEDHILEDLGSANGTRINGQPQTRHILQHRDVIELGAHHLCYMNSRLAAELSMDQTMLIEALPRDLTSGEVPPAAPLASKASQVYFPDGHVKVLTTAGRHAAGDIVRLDRVVTTFGTPGEQLVVLTRRPQGFFLSHVEGPRPPRINQQGITQPGHPLADGDRIEAAGYRLEFHLDRRSDSRL